MTIDTNIQIDDNYTTWKRDARTSLRQHLHAANTIIRDLKQARKPKNLEAFRDTYPDAFPSSKGWTPDLVFANGIPQELDRLRESARETHLMLGFLNGTPYEAMEPNARNPVSEKRLEKLRAICSPDPISERFRPAVRESLRMAG